jgi:hypothetical protein
MGHGSMHLSQKSWEELFCDEASSRSVEAFLFLAGGLWFYLLLLSNQNWARIFKLLI